MNTAEKTIYGNKDFDEGVKHGMELGKLHTRPKITRSFEKGAAIGLALGMLIMWAILQHQF